MSEHPHLPGPDLPRDTPGHRSWLSLVAVLIAIASTGVVDLQIHVRGECARSPERIASQGR